MAYFQPERALKVTRWLIDNPTDHLSDEHSAWRLYLATDYSGVLQALPPALEARCDDLGHPSRGAESVVGARSGR